MVLQEIFGVNAHIRDVTERYAAAGYLALAPATLRELRDAALADEHGHKLQAALAQHALT